MELNDLKIFKTVAKHKSISKAANELGYAQSNISMRVQVLEEELDVKLFTRSKNGSVLNEDGELLLDYVSQILNLTNEIEQKFKKRKKEVVIAGKQTILSSVLPRIINKIYQDDMELKVNVKELTNENLYESILREDIDCIFSYERIEDNNFIEIDRYKDEVVLVSNMRIKDIMKIDKPIIISSIENCPYKSFALGWIKEKKFDKNKIIFSDTLESVIQLIKNGVGVSFLPKRLVGTYNELDFYELKEDNNLIEIYLYINKRIINSEKIKLVIEDVFNFPKIYN
ncbi:MAG: LysR family transcriptional regulator [Sarcina sp.]